MIADVLTMLPDDVVTRYSMRFEPICNPSFASCEDVAEFVLNEVFESQWVRKLDIKIKYIIFPE